ncbi:hypothetical protein [Micromonospora sp. NPDC049497]|uniref:hypothetical protein n=1 Tax=Micromonospora sp. NPDC049497 TaxID=3364273 RepID=UPI0037BB394F
MRSDGRSGTPRLRRGGAVLAALLIGAGLVAPAPASGEPLPTTYQPVTATVWANSPTTTAEYRPGGGYTANSTGGDVFVRRTGTGAYTVILEGAATTGGVAHAVAYGGGPVHCTVTAWYPSLLGGDDQLILVRCFAATGTPTDSRFVASFTSVRQVSRGRLAYFVTDQTVPTGVRTIPSSYRYDSTGGVISYERLSTGRYRFHLNPNPDTEVGYTFPMTHVTALGSTAVHCQTGWPDSRQVWCVNAAGNPVDALFTVTYGSRVDLLGRATGPRFASGTLYANWISDGRISGDGYNSTVGSWSTGASGRHLGTGRYEIAFQGTATAFGTALANAHLDNLEGSRPRGWCVVAGWGSAGPDTRVLVNCYAYFGVPANLNARISFTTWPAG